MDVIIVIRNNVPSVFNMGSWNIIMKDQEKKKISFSDGKLLICETKEMPITSTTRVGTGTSDMEHTLQ